MLARGLIISRRFVQVRTAPVHPHIKLSKYRTRIKPTWWKWLDEFPCTLNNTLLIIWNRFGPYFASKGLGYLAALLLLLLLLARYKLSCYQTTPLLTILALAGITLLKTTCHFLLLLIGFDTLFRGGWSTDSYEDRRTAPLSVRRGAEIARRADRGKAHEQFT